MRIIWDMKNYVTLLPFHLSTVLTHLPPGVNREKMLPLLNENLFTFIQFVKITGIR